MYSVGEGQGEAIFHPFLLSLHLLLSRFKLPVHKQWAYCTVLLTQIGRSEEWRCIVPRKAYSFFFNKVGICR